MKWKKNANNLLSGKETHSNGNQNEKEKLYQKKNKKEKELIFGYDLMNKN